MSRVISIAHVLSIFLELSTATTVGVLSMENINEKDVMQYHTVTAVFLGVSEPCNESMKSLTYAKGILPHFADVRKACVTMIFFT